MSHDAMGHECEECQETRSLDPVKVTGYMTGTMRTNAEAADYASYTTFFFTGTNDAPQQILGRDNDRQRAVIQLSTGSAYIGKMEQIFNPNQGWLQTNTMIPLELRNKQAVWAVGVAGSPSSISVLNERWNSARTD